MTNIVDKYVKNERVTRAYIASDAAYGFITVDEIIELCKDKRVQDNFIGEGVKHKKPKEEWDKEYLELLLCSSVAERFNEEYLLYLHEVGEYVRNKKNIDDLLKKSTFLGILVFVLGGALGFTIGRRSN